MQYRFKLCLGKNKKNKTIINDTEFKFNYFYFLKVEMNVQVVRTCRERER